MIKIWLAVLGNLEEWRKYWLDDMDGSELSWCNCQLGKELFVGKFSSSTHWNFLIRMMVQLMMARMIAQMMQAQLAKEQEPLLKGLMVRKPVILKM